MRTPPIQEQVDGDEVSPELPPLLLRVYKEVQREQVSLGAIKLALRALLEYLASSAGRTNANCVAADSFFMRSDAWESDWDRLPVEFQDIFADVAGALHDTVSAPEIAENFDSTPEQLLWRVLQLPVPPDRAQQWQGTPSCP
jgi:hypothetical protein